MAEHRKDLAHAIVTFFTSEIENNQLGADGIEGLEVAIQCIQSAYDIEDYQSSNNKNLLEIYAPSKNTEGASDSKPATAEQKISAEALKMSGNDLMKNGLLEEAIESYTKAINLDGSNAVYFCNRAAAWTKLNENTKAINDCRKAIKIDPSYSKAYGRLGLVCLNEKKYEEAVNNYEKAVNLEPANVSYQDNLEVAKEKLKSSATTSKPAAPPSTNPLAGMDVGALFSNPAVMNMAQSFMQNPQMQNVFSRMMSGAQTPPQPTNNPSQTTNNEPATADPTPGGMRFPEGMDYNSVINATASFAQQMQEQNPEMLENLRSQFQQNPSNNNQSNDGPGNH